MTRVFKPMNRFLSISLPLIILNTRPSSTSYPICYDYKVSNRTLCPVRNFVGGFSAGYYPVCYHTVMWKEYSPPPTCREQGCNYDSNSACCCGADPTLVCSRTLTNWQINMMFLDRLC